ncbi:glyoxylase-like metal-dependent hydrolase (beta-lactamase superfamily II) [Roseimicrobium gellanilyticum]|uniref:Glyoxylase-like metal-dependent hydrolase (Beta-lactamase superfamily II) n=1 Tax=Roseimicrobium gellanilyticum TaxID=748857 RepID=A0A366HJD1_9BACT|nr:MBL fold metallo-hydrolase [Roseimicrobium gellanilyticum]RBP42354.1 glyoxylase-like metal-dependent hydrolase (beta-lactamase superfamily II) [Roseimicrobium gellanilyticum]
MQIHPIDLHFQGQTEIIAAYLIETGKDLALIETGPGSTLPTLLEGIRTLGYSPEAVKHVFVTHIHLDHSGAAGWWAQQGATVYAHPRAVPHLVDPSKLIESAQRIYQDRMQTLWGDILPAPAERVVTLKDGDAVKLGKTVITAIDTPGHARHHHAYAIGDVCFTGDVAGMKLPHSSYVSVTAAPPQFDPVAYGDSLQRLHAANFSKLYLTHFGEVTDVAGHLSRYASRVEQCYECISDLLAQGLKGEALREAYGAAERAIATQVGVSDADWAKYEGANNTAMCADGIALFCEKSPR